VRGRITQLLDEGASPEIVVDEVVLRGDDWLDQRWRDGSDQLKHLALARRAEGLTIEEFSERWQAHAGHVSTPGARSPSSAIPAEVQGLAYVQNHLRVGATDDLGYDAVNEVYFDELESLRARIAWFEENEVGVTGDDLFGPSVFLAVREVVVLPVSASV